MKFQFLLLGLTLLLAGCVANSTDSELPPALAAAKAEEDAARQANPELFALCEEKGLPMMSMTEMIDGETVSEEACWGCMPDGMNHLCNVNDLRAYYG